MKIDYGWKSTDDFRRWGPYLSYGVKASSEMRISWNSKFYSLSRVLEYGKDESCENKIEEKIAPSNHHMVILKGLEPNTTYYFKINRPEDLQEKTQPIYSFTTGPEEGSTEPFDIGIISDGHAQDGNLSPAFRAMEKNVPNMKFLATAGDCVTHGGVEEAWNNFFFQYSKYSTKWPLMNATGNHDTDHPESYAHFIQTWGHPFVDTDIGAHYYFIYGNAVFIMLDSDNAGQTKGMQGVVSDEQLEWLEETLEKFAKKDYWIFVFMHHPIYSLGDTGIMQIYELAYADLFDEYQVDAVFYGHDHHFEAYWKGRDEPWGGTNYFLVGNGGGGLDLFNTDPTYKEHGPNYLWKGRTYIPERDGILGGYVNGGVRNDEIVKKYFVYGIIEHGFTQLHIEGDTCTLQMWSWHNKVLFKYVFKRTGKGKKYHTPEYRQEF